MFELLIPPEKAHLSRFAGGRKRYDHELRPRLMTETIQELHDAGVKPDAWNVEGLPVRWRANGVTREQAVNGIAQRYRKFVHIFAEKARAA